MSVKDMLTAALFKRDEAGRTVMYPNGIAGRGYFLPDAAAEQRMRRILMWMVIGAGLYGGLVMQVLTLRYGQVPDWTGEPWTIALSALAVLGIGYRLIVRRLTRGLALANQRMGVLEGLRRQAEAMPRWYLWCIAVLAPPLAAGSVWWMAAFASIPNCLIGLAGTLLFGVATAQAVYGLRHRSLS
ncbi:MAG TPA: hypothetical protein VFA64_18655 [Hyphomicrobiaceae bacterium]|nr:hypothetical protein [Hyphomicrobiaceae bacterium]